MIHCNGHLVCSIDCETTGLHPRENSIWEIAIVPLDFDLKPDPLYHAFHLEMQPRSHTEPIDYSFCSKQKLQWLWDNGLNPNIGMDLLIEWIERLDLPINKRIMPLAQNWPFDRSFIEDWIGPRSFNLYFDGQFRDLMPVSVFTNDCDAFNAGKYHFPKHNLSYICNQLGLECDRDLFHGAMYDAVKTAEAYRKLCLSTKCFA